MYIFIMYPSILAYYDSHCQWYNVRLMLFLLNFVCFNMTSNFVVFCFRILLWFLILDIREICCRWSLKLKVNVWPHVVCAELLMSYVDGSFWVSHVTMATNLSS